MRILWNGKNVFNIPPQLVNNKLITEFEAKANIFNKYFASQCTTISKNRILIGLLFKVKCMGKDGNFLKLIENFFSRTLRNKLRKCYI